MALTVQARIISREDLRIDHAWTIDLLAILAGIVGGKLWFVVLHRRDHRREGWCIQGVLAGLVAVSLPLLANMRTPSVPSSMHPRPD